MTRPATTAAAGALFTDGGETALSQCTISGNSVSGPFGSGGGLQLQFGTTTLTSCSVIGNVANIGGGGSWLW